MKTEHTVTHFSFIYSSITRFSKILAECRVFIRGMVMDVYKLFQKLTHVAVVTVHFLWQPGRAPIPGYQ